MFCRSIFVACVNLNDFNLILAMFLHCDSIVILIQELMAQGMSSGQAIALVAEELRANHSGERIVARFEDEDE